MSLRAHLEAEPKTGERRSSPRRKLRLEAEGVSATAGDTQVVIHDLLKTGCSSKAPCRWPKANVLEVVLPEAGTAQAEVAWASDRFFGCKFNRPISTAAVSAALLRSPGPGQPNQEATEKALIELEALSFAIKRVTKAVDQAIDRLTKRARLGRHPEEVVLVAVFDLHADDIARRKMACIAQMHFAVDFRRVRL